jgi:histidine phosphotransfer protein HptB
MNDQVIDRTVYAELRTTTGAEFVAELVDTFLEDAPRMLAELRSALNDGHADRFRRAAHSLKSNANTFGAANLAKLARELELRGLNAEPARDAAALTDLEEAYARTAAELKVLRHG